MQLADNPNGEQRGKWTAEQIFTHSEEQKVGGARGRFVGSHPMERISVWGQKKKQAIPRTVLVGEHYPMSISPTVIPIGFINPDPKGGCALRGDL